VRQVDITDKINVTEEEVRTYYAANAKEFISPAEVTLREILLAVPITDRGINVAEDDAARDKAEDVRKRLLAGESSASLASEFSAAASKATGFLVGPLKVDELAPELQAVVQALAIGQPTEVLKTSGGYRILVLESRSETKVRTLEEARGDVARRVADQKSRGETLRYLEQLREQAKIVWRHEELQKAYDKALADRRSAIAAAKS
jgi:peptidyl-prolyl cis-trans isomerase SurA